MDKSQKPSTSTHDEEVSLSPLKKRRRVTLSQTEKQRILNPSGFLSIIYVPGKENMIPLKDNTDLISFLVTKHSWKGRYKRVFSIGSHGITTYNPEKLEVTNRWPYSEIVTIATSKHSNNSNNHDFVLQMKKDRKIDTMKFSSEHKCLILTEALKYRHLFAEKPKEFFRYEAYKHHWSDIKLPIILEVGPCSLDQLDPATRTVLASYPYHTIEGVIAVQDYPNGFVIACGGFSRLHLFASNSYAELRNKMLELANLTLSISIKVLNATITVDDFHNQRFGKYSGDIHQTSLTEFPVQKLNSVRHMEPPKRILCLSETCLIERDPHSYSVCTLKPLAEVFALVRDNADPQLFCVEYLSGQVGTYRTSDRDALLASLVDGVRSAGNRDVLVRMKRTPRGKRLGPLHVPVDEETESHHLRLFQNSCNMSRAEVIERFNANVGYSGLIYSVNQDRLFSENKEKLIVQALSGIMQANPVNAVKDAPLLELEGMFQALRRLCASKAGYAAFTSLPGFREWIGGVTVSALRRDSTALSHAALDSLCALLQPMHADADIRQEQANKTSMLASVPFLKALLDMATRYANQYSGSLVVAAMLDLLTFSLCAPYSETTEGRLFDQLLELVAERGRDLFKLFEHPSMAIVKGAGLVMRALIQEGTDDIGRKMQSLALSEAVVLRHMISSLYPRQRSAQQTSLSRHLVSLWTEEHEPAARVLSTIFPQGLLAFLESSDPVPADAEEAQEERDNLLLAQKSCLAPSAIRVKVQRVEKQLQHYANLALQHWAQHTGMVIERKDSTREQRPVVLRKRRERIKTQRNWPLFYYQFDKDHALPNLIWNHTTREELRSALESELRSFTSERELAAGQVVAWNHAEFRVDYASLQQECKVGDYYLRLLLERPGEVLRKCYEFFNELYHRYLTSSKVDMKCMCLQAMSIVYDKYYEDIGPFADTNFILHMLDRTCESGERDRLVLVCCALARHRDNVRMLASAARSLAELGALAHTHVSRAAVPALHREIRGANNDADLDLKEWHYIGEGESRHGPFSVTELKELFESNKISGRTRVWARGMEAWRTLGSVAQLKWAVACRAGCGAQMDPSQLATALLSLWLRCCGHLPSRNEDQAIIRPLPRMKRYLSDSETLPHIVQLLLTFDPIIVEKVATLLYEIMHDNPEMPKVYLTGVFYFILMYTGSNVLPIARFLHLTHMQQAFRADENATSDIMQQSILGQLLPEAMVCYLHNHGPEKFAQIFLGEYDTPEAIWNSEMRRMLTMKISAHIGEFTPRLRANVLARYPYLPIPAVRYPQLEQELFCHIFYLRHLCDEQRFPQWPIPDPIRLLKEVLTAWRVEVSREPGELSAGAALATLGLETESDDHTVRRAYYKLAHQYHPDRDPNGREMFEKVNAAYEYLCSRNVWKGEGPNPDNIMLILRTQTILFERYSQELSEYAYAGYEALVRTMKLESESDALFSSETNVLPAAVRLAHATLNCCALNVDELVRAGGLQVLSNALQRCASVVTGESRPEDVSVQVCEQCARCVAVAAQFPQALEIIETDAPLLDHIAQLLTLHKLTSSCTAAANAAGAVCRASSARSRLSRAAAPQRLLALTLNYDHTLTDTGVDTNADNNKQERVNQLALAAVDACGKLASHCEDTDATQSDKYIIDGFKRLLTPHLYAKLFDQDHSELLKLLTTNSRTPYLIWDNSTRAELTDYLESVKPVYEEGGDDLPLVAENFEYSAHKGMLIIGGIFVEIYNENPTFTIENPRQFVLDLLAYIKQCTLEEMNEKRIVRLVIALDALANVILQNQGVEIQCIGQLGTLFSLLGNGDGRVRGAALRALSAATNSNDCLEDVAAEQVLGYLLYLITEVTEDDLIVLKIFNALIVNTKIVKEALSKGGVLYLLELFSCHKVNDVRVIAAETLSRMIADKLHGPKVARFLAAWLPEGLVTSLASDSALQAIALHDGVHNTPELVWDVACRTRLHTRLQRVSRSHRAAQKCRHDAILHRDAVQADVNTEVVVGGVYLRLYLESPAWPLRNPRQFLQELFQETLSVIAKEPNEERTRLCAQSLAALLRARPALCDAAARLGHMPALSRLLNKAPDLLLPSLVCLSSTQSCVMALSHTDIVIQLRETLKSSPEHTELSCLVISEMFSAQINTEQLVYQALEYSLVESLLCVLENCNAGVGAGGAARAVKALRCMAESPQHGQRVKGLLNASQAWQKYSSLKQDLFIPDTRAAALTAAPPRTAGYLTQARPTTQVPPPIE